MLLIPSSLTVAESPDRGRRLLAAAPLKPGELIATFENPLVAIPGSADLGTTMCSYCLSRPLPAGPEQEADERREGLLEGKEEKEKRRGEENQTR